jgi:hypothetical protein
VRLPIPPPGRPCSGSAAIGTKAVIALSISEYLYTSQAMLYFAVHDAEKQA